jgi:hypothetical protein
MFILRGHMFKFRGAYDMYTTKIVGQRSSLVPQIKGSHTPI